MRVGDGSVPSGTTLRSARRARGLSLRAVAAATGVSPAALSQFENGKSTLAQERLVVVAIHLGLAVEKPKPNPAERNSTFEHWRTFGPPVIDTVLAASLDMFAEFGYHGTSIRQIADLAHMSVAGVYHYYPNKQALLVALMDTGLRELIARSEAARNEGRHPVERLEMLVEAIVLYHLHRQKHAFIGVSELRALSPENRAAHVTLRNRQQRLVDDTVAAAQHTGAVSVQNTKSASRALVTMCTAVVGWYRPDGPDTPSDIALQYVAYTLGLLGYQASDAIAVKDPLARSARPSTEI